MSLIRGHQHVCSVVSNSLQPFALQPARLLCPWGFPGKNTGVGCHFLHQGIFLTQGSSVSPALQVDSLPSEPSLTLTYQGLHALQESRTAFAPGLYSADSPTSSVSPYPLLISHIPGNRSLAHIHSLPFFFHYLPLYLRNSDTLEIEREILRRQRSKWLRMTCSLFRKTFQKR